MTHDELLAMIDFNAVEGSFDIPVNSDRFNMLANNSRALRSVVELHKPYQHEVVSYVFCKGCTIDLDLAPPYPCETIEIIEKELL